MKNKSILLAFTALFIVSSKALAQDAVFSQWENMPLYINPALTGNFDGVVRLRAKYRNQWASILKSSSFKTSAVSAEYKFVTESTRQFSVGVAGVHDIAGSLDFMNNELKVSTSLLQNLGDPDNVHHAIAFGLDVGMIQRKIDDINAHWPGGIDTTELDDKTSFADVSLGLLWQYKSNTHFSFQLGSALHHLNKPDVTFSKTGGENLSSRLNLHGQVEIPLGRPFSIIPSFLFVSQGPSEQLLFGCSGRWYPKWLNSNYVQLGYFGKTNRNYKGTTDVNVYVVSATVEIESFLLGFSIDRFQEVESNAYEFSLGYTFGMHSSKGITGNINASQEGIVK